ncbi:MAG: ABC-type transport system, ATP-binding component [Candidatus Kaiserbacteria bacterium GW2011_GWA2_49_19]|uniref:ABC-type transport system, ATP-binding component n=1 Tax=Candidatus Kaiserbacteria bacterium GW2011_GWA2_49_19 TaxID=1618669 RepID=A0A0G1VT82_9BACT|nr:MAG: ABC-type transport system, ATP-binding component [Candidatus Kaiserbacteria bacterium GW2011_GWA2_49_19]
MTPRNTVIEVNNLAKNFGKVPAVKGISFNVYEGEICGLLGPNGAGKTTTIQMLLDLITPTSGSVKIFGKEMKGNREEILGAMNFSSPYVSLPGNLKVIENLKTFARLYGVKDIKGKIAELADFFEIQDFLSKMTSRLSTGQLTRLNLTKALLNDPKLLLLDEPTSSLDPDIADRTRQMLLKIRSERQVTMLYTSHNMAEVEEIYDRVIFINHGEIKDEGTPAELVVKYGKQDLNDVFLHIARGQ